MNKNNNLIILIFVIFLIIFDFTYSTFRRLILSKYYYKKYLLKSTKKKLIIGDPCRGHSGLVTILLGNNRILPHGDVTLDLYGCNKSLKYDINNDTDWNKLESNKYIVLDSGTLPFSKDIKQVLIQIKRISGGDFYTGGSTSSAYWKLYGANRYSLKYNTSLNYIIYPFNSSKDKYFTCYNRKKCKYEKYDFQNL